MLCVSYLWNSSFVTTAYFVVVALKKAVTCIFSDEQERVQKKTFTNWMNTYLKQVSTCTNANLP